MKIRILAAAAALAMATGSATGAGADARPIDNLRPTSVAMDLTECQYAQYIRCMVISGDHGFCIEQAQTTVC